MQTDLRGLVRQNSMWDKVVLKKVRNLLGGRVRMIFTGSAPIAAHVLDFLRAAFGCQVICLHITPLTEEGECFLEPRIVYMYLWSEQSSKEMSLTKDFVIIAHKFRLLINIKSFEFLTYKNFCAVLLCPFHVIAHFLTVFDLSPLKWCIVCLFVCLFVCVCRYLRAMGRRSARQAALPPCLAM